ncbi:hypothetical protein [Pseudoxanthomonas sp. UTMC 1351]|uniref:hypothetical protein n=1 Tax=Pseudoxanthomonas sp. UTMC 1351 TaxID=2695853 RepID=UPI0034CFAA62
MSDEKAALRAIVRENLDAIMATLNAALKGEGLEVLEPVIARIARGGQLPHWYQELKERHTIVNLDGKTIGSILEMLLVAVLETGVLAKAAIKLRVNPARGVDLPDLDLGVKSPSKNYCTSEPFFSAYERLYGNEYDCLVLLTDYQEAKKAKGDFRLQVQSWRYMRGSEIADFELCRIARKHRDWLLAEGTSTAMRVFRFLAYVNQGDWRARWLLVLADHMKERPEQFDQILEIIKKDYAKQNKTRLKNDRELIPEADLRSLQKIFGVDPRHLGVINELENWVGEFLKDASRAPNENEEKRLVHCPLDGKIGLSFALQWRYNFGRAFGASNEELALSGDLCATTQGDVA